MIKKLLLLPLLTLFVPIVAHSQINVQCGPPKFKPPSQQYRGKLKHRAIGAPTGTIIHATDMYNFPDETVDDAGADTNGPIPDSPETQTFTLDAFLWQAKVEPNDCEVHLELNDSKTKSDERRVIVEIPPDDDVRSDYQAILQLIKKKFPKTKVFGPDIPFRFASSVHVRITGFGFFDGVHLHFAQAEGGNGGHGSPSVQTFWELHPAWHVTILN